MQLSKRLIVVSILALTTLCIAYGFLGWWTITHPKNAELWFKWASGFPKLMEEWFGVRGYLGTALRAITSGTSTIVLLVVLTSRLIVITAYSLWIGAISPVIRMVVFYTIAAFLAHASLVWLFAFYPNDYNAFFDWSSRQVGELHNWIETSDIYTLAFKTAVLDAKPLMIVILTFIWRAILWIAGAVAGRSTGDINYDKLPVRRHPGPRTLSRLPPARLTRADVAARETLNERLRRAGHE